jgi:hypothetical protein
MTQVFLLWFLVTTSDAIGALLAAVLLFKLGSRYARFQAVVFAGIAFEAVVAASTLILLWPQEVTVAFSFALSRSLARAVKSGAVWAYVFYLFNLCGRRPGRQANGG